MIGQGQEVPMRRVGALFAVLTFAVAPVAMARFGTSKTRLKLSRSRPPQIPILSAQVLVDVTPATPDVRPEDVDTVRRRVKEAIEGTTLYRLVDNHQEGAGTVSVSLSPSSAEVRTVTEQGSQEGYTTGHADDRGVYFETSYTTVSWTRRVAEGRIEAEITVRQGQDSQSRLVSASYPSATMLRPPDAQSVESLKIDLVQDIATRVAALVGYTSDPVQMMLAVNGELKDGNRLAQAGQFEDALVRWSSHPLKGGAEAARLHNMGVAHEATAYRLPIRSPEHRNELGLARDLYKKATDLDPGEKYFKQSLQRIAVSLEYAEAVRSLVEHLDSGDEPLSEPTIVPEPAPPPPSASRPSSSPGR
jgi:hypothetical protein